LLCNPSPWFGDCSAITAESQRGVGRIQKAAAAALLLPAPSQQRSPNPFFCLPQHVGCIQYILAAFRDYVGILTPESKKSLENMAWTDFEDTGQKQPSILAKSPKTPEVEETNSAGAWQDRATQL